MHGTDVLAIEPRTFQQWQAEAAAAGPIEARLPPPVRTTLVPGRRGRGDVAVITLTGFVSQKPSIFSVLSARW